jgi:phosphatidate cytidylyltransferase
VPESGPLGADPVAATARNNLALRIASAVVLVPLALFVTYMGGVPFALFWAAAAAAVLWEWSRLVSGPLWFAAGIAYAAVIFVAPIVLRANAEFGFQAMVLLFAIVWPTDICGYFAGRAIGGPKLMPMVSPKKTWAGAVAGAAGAIVVALLAAQWLGQFNRVGIVLIALALSIVAQFGDLLESWIKRRFGAKDASHIIPGHGGVMDRLDGFWAAALVAVVVGVARGGFDGAARGLLVW